MILNYSCSNIVKNLYMVPSYLKLVNKLNNKIIMILNYPLNNLDCLSSGIQSDTCHHFDAELIS